MSSQSNVVAGITGTKSLGHDLATLTLNNTKYNHDN